MRGIVSDECPVSYITPQSKTAIQLYYRARSLQEAGMPSHSSKELPIPLADAFVQIAREENAADAARYENEILEAKAGR